MTHIVFDLGMVLIGWQPHLAFRHHFASDADTLAWMDRVDFHGWNYANDAGRSMADAMVQARADHGAEAAPLAEYPGRFADTIAHPVPGSWAIAEDLATRHRMFAITNFGRETWPAAVRLYPRLSLFEDIVISGVERLAKPDPAIYRLLCDRNGIAARDCLFIDDSPANVAAARDLGMDAVHFTGAADLAADLRRRGLA